MYFFGLTRMAGHAGLSAVVSRQSLVGLGRREYPVTRDHHPGPQENCGNRTTFGRIIGGGRHSYLLSNGIPNGRILPWVRIFKKNLRTLTYIVKIDGILCK
jgi:hypothetical protein